MANEKKRRLNVVDIAVILIVVGAIGFFGWRMLSGKNEVAQTQTMTFTVRLDALSQEIYEDIDKYEGPVQLISSEKALDAYVVSHTAFPVEVLEMETPGATSKDGTVGTLIFAPDKEYVTATFTVEATANPNDQLSNIGSQEVRTGRAYILKTEYYELLGVVVSVDRPWVSE